MPAQGCCNPGFQIRLEVIATLKGLRRNFAESQQASQPLQGCEESVTGTMTQGFKANPGLELANAFSVKFLGAISERFSAWSPFAFQDQ